MNHHHNSEHLDLTNRLRHYTTPTTGGDVIPITEARRIRRWDEPQTPDPYPERPTPHPGARQTDHTDHQPDWESMNGLPTIEPVVQQTTTAPRRVITTPRDTRPDRPFPAPTPTSDQRRTSRLTWWAVGLSIVAQATVTAALRWGDAGPIPAAAVSVGMLLCSLLLIAAEQVTVRAGR